jgi:hypothetical protein
MTQVDQFFMSPPDQFLMSLDSISSILPTTPHQSAAKAIKRTPPREWPFRGGD